MSSFTKKTIRTTIYLREGTFTGGANTVVFEGLPVDVSITKPGGKEMNKASVTVQNMKLDTIKQLTMLAFRKLQSFNNVIKIEAGIAGQKLDTLFEGEITSSVPSISDDGDISLKIDCKTGYYPNQLPTPPTSIASEVSIANLMKQFADEASYAFENKGVSGSISNCVFAGSPIMKAKTLAEQTGIDLLIDDRKFIIQPYDREKEGTILLVSDKSGLIGYPSFTNDGVTCKSLFNAKFELGGFFELQSILPNASGIWKISKLEHKISANKNDGGDWLTNLTGVWVQEAEQTTSQVDGQVK